MGIGVLATGDDYQEVGFTEGNLLFFLVVFTNEAHQLRLIVLFNSGAI